MHSDKEMTKKMKKPSMKNMASKMMEKSGKWVNDSIDRGMESGMPMTGEQAKKWREGKYKDMD